MKAARALGIHVSLQQCKDYLRRQPAYSLYRPARRNYKRNKIEANKPGEVVQIDIAVFLKEQRANKGFAYCLLLSDTYSKYVAGIAMKNRDKTTVVRSLEKLLDSLPFSTTAIYW